ncbi:hypothetical protein C8R44DRAFT_440734 [Mycena epipterygia]|nr:hypothetical protein C8R44DRAFT_440734 [Mycena epipterygia]
MSPGLTLLPSPAPQITPPAPKMTPPTPLLSMQMRTPMPTPTQSQTQTHPATRFFELLFSAAATFLLTSALLPLFHLHPSPLTVLRVTGLCTLLVFAGVDCLLSVWRMRGNGRMGVEEENPRFTITPRRIRDVEAWPHEKKSERDEQVSE